MWLLCCVNHFEVNCGGDYCGFLDIQNGCLCLAVWRETGPCVLVGYVVGCLCTCIYYRNLAPRK